MAKARCKSFGWVREMPGSQVQYPRCEKTKNHEGKHTAVVTLSFGKKLEMWWKAGIRRTRGA